MRRILLLGHRGARAVKSIPENSLASFDRALADGCDGFEFDVRLTGDGQAVICHDPQFNGIELSTVNARELSQLARLEQVLARYQERAFLDIELKVACLERIVIAELKKYLPVRGFVVSSFLPEILRTLHEEDAQLPLGLICETHAELKRWQQIAIDYVILHQQLVDAVLIRQIQASGKKIFVWTVNSAAKIRRFADSGVDGIVSDDPKLLSQILKD